MLKDLVLDTNVLVHAQNPQESRCKASKNLLDVILLKQTVLCVDKGFDLDSARNRSFIGHEYIQHVRYGTFPYAILMKLALQQRICQLPKSPGRRATNIINQRVTNKRDRVFLCVAYNSVEKVLVSHDGRHLPPKTRSFFKSSLKILVEEATEVLPRL